MEKENYSFDELETEAYRNLNEIRTLRNRLKRYWVKLTKESLKVAKREGLELRLVQGPVIHNASEIAVFDNPNGLNDTNLLKLARTSYPSLYRRYQEGLERYTELRQKLEELDARLEYITKQH